MVKEIRTNSRRYDEGLTLYIYSPEAYLYFRHLDSIVKNGDFTGFDGIYHVRHFGVEISDKLASWFFNNEVDLIYRQVICWLAAKYALDPEKRDILESQLYPPVFDEVRKLYTKYFEPHEPIHENYGNYIRNQLYLSVCKEYYGAAPPEILTVYCDDEEEEQIRAQWGFHAEFDIRVVRFYFDEDDWDRIIVNRERDNLIRVESSEEYWNKWKHQFMTYETTKQHHFGVFSKDPDKGLIYLINEVGTNFHKIGYTSKDDIHQRLVMLQTGNAGRLHVVGKFSCAGRGTEQVLHRIFEGNKERGEWFDLSKDDVMNILDEKWRISQNIF